MITKLFPNQCNVYARGPVGENVLHVAMLLNTPPTLAIARYLIKLYGAQLVNCPIQVSTFNPGMLCYFQLFYNSSAAPVCCTPLWGCSSHGV
jgi:hypothetical protein